MKLLFTAHTFYAVTYLNLKKLHFPLILSRAEAGPNRGAEEVHREAPVPHQDAGDHSEDAG